MELWIKYLQNARNFYLSEGEWLTSAPIASKADAEQCGYLEKLGRFNKWKCRWFVLRDGVLFRYNTRVCIYILFLNNNTLILILFNLKGRRSYWEISIIQSRINGISS